MPTLTLELPDELMVKLEAVSRREHMTVEQYVEQMIDIWIQAGTDQQLEFEFKK